MSAPADTSPPKPDGKPRCGWPRSEIALRYHDEEWGVPLRDDRKIFEFLVLDAAQAGLSWEIILRKREGFRAAFDNFDAEKVARYDARRVQKLLADPGIIRNRLKIESAIANARAFLQVQEECGSFASYIWQFVDGKPHRESPALAQGGAGADGSIRRHEQGAEEARVPVRGLDHLLRLHAGRRHGERPHGGLLPARAPGQADARLEN